ncbi:MAG: hypothetical protein RLZZ262_2266, partial [Bacteroidota bacterium]
MIFFVPTLGSVAILQAMKADPRQIRIENYTYHLPDENV